MSGKGVKKDRKVCRRVDGDAKMATDLKHAQSELDAGLAALPVRPVLVDLPSGLLSGESIGNAVRCIKDLKGFFGDEAARLTHDPAQVVYRVQTFCPVGEGTAGGLFWGTTFIEPGTVGGEYFMTKGHHHADRNRSEFYLTVAGSGALILMNENRRTRFEPMSPGTLHYIPAHTAHRVANVGESTLAFLACWPSDAGHDYESIAAQGFGARLLNVGGVPTLVEEA
jgi:glucose-6-phosphate isomerase, archaeal